MGGMHGFGPVEPEPDEPLVPCRVGAARVRAHAGDGRDRRVEPRRVALRPRGTGRRGDYLARRTTSSGWPGWSGCSATAGSCRGRARGRPVARAAAPAGPPAEAAAVAPMLRNGGPTDRPAERPARFAAGDRVRARNLHPRTHTRLPRYVRGHVGEVVAVHGCHVFPDANAHGGGEDPQWLYSVRFAARELWGDGGRPRRRRPSTPSSPTWSRRERAGRPEALPARPRRRRPGLRRAVGGAGVRARRHAARGAAPSPGTSGPPRWSTHCAATPSAATTRAGWPRWRA